MIRLMNRFFVPILVAFSVFSCKIADDDSIALSEVFVKYYGEPGSQVAADFIYNESLNSFILFGSQNLDLVPDTRSDLFFITTTDDGSTIATRTIDITRPGLINGELVLVSGDDIAVRIKPINDTEYVFAVTSTHNDTSRIVWGIIDHNLNLIKNANNDSLHFIESNGGAIIIGNDIALSQYDPTTLIIFGTTVRAESGDFVSGTGTRFFLSRVGLVEDTTYWRKSLGDEGNDVANSFFERPDGTMQLFGMTETLADGGLGGTNIFSLGVNNLGNPDGSSDVLGFERGSITNLNDRVGAVIQVGSQFVMAGTSSLVDNSQPYPFLAFFGSNGLVRGGAYSTDILRSSLNSDLTGSGYTVTKTVDGDLLLAGSFQSFELEGEGRQEEVMILKTNAFGQYLPGYDEYYGLISGNDRATASLTLPDGKIALLCTFDFGSGTTLMGLMKLNKDGKLSP